MHIVLLGDSVFDNAAYVGGGPDVIRQLQARLPAGAEATLAAVDGAVVRSVERQVQSAPRSATHLFVSAGGNDALGGMGVLERPVRAVGEGLLNLAELMRGFERDYRAMLDAVLARRLPTTVCTIYYPRYADPRMQEVAYGGLALFNDCILREAFARGLPVIDLRFVCDEDADFANPIEPSAIGGDKIAAAIVSVASEHDFSAGRSAVWTR